MYNPFDDFFVGANYSETIFDDQAPIAIEQGEPPFRGRYRPIEGNFLKLFNGQNIYGTWKLQIYDMFDWNTGTLDTFELFVTIPEPTSGIFLIIGVCFIGLCRPEEHS